MVGVHTDANVLKTLLSEKLPKISAHIAALDVDIGAICMQWFLTLFVTVLPLEVCLYMYRYAYMGVCECV